MKEAAGRRRQSAAASASPCAACRLLRRRCVQGCVFAPHFPAEEPRKFACVHRVFGASNVSKLLQEMAVQHRGDAVRSLVFEADARVRDPVYGCVALISSLHRQIQSLQAQLALSQAHILHLRMHRTATATATAAAANVASGGHITSAASSSLSLEVDQTAKFY
ncbi:LOB domain-containing protein 4-like [Curcuma longa]|uniref:LOB domain-containing protein 4-like n=1 Tax=Curcuma longa TaxID=136217 RepID=UPI003D9F9591